MVEGVGDADPHPNFSSLFFRDLSLLGEYARLDFGADRRLNVTSAL